MDVISIKRPNLSFVPNIFSSRHRNGFQYAFGIASFDKDNAGLCKKKLPLVVDGRVAAACRLYAYKTITPSDRYFAERPAGVRQNPMMHPPS
jgi:hypothetical protein